MTAILTSSVSVDSVLVSRDPGFLRVVAAFTQDDELARDVEAYYKPRKRGVEAVPHPGAVRSSGWDVSASTLDGTLLPSRGARGGDAGDEDQYTWIFDASHLPDGDAVVITIRDEGTTVYASFLKPTARARNYAR